MSATTELYPRIQAGDIIEWQNVPMVVIGIYHRGEPHHTGGWNDMGTTAYLRDTNSGSSPIKAGQVQHRFHLYGKQLWTGELTEAEQAMAMRFLLLGVNT